MNEFAMILSGSDEPTPAPRVPAIESQAGHREGSLEMTDTFTMTIETSEGVKPHGFHLGSQLPIAESFAIEALQRAGVRTVALYHGSKLHKIYDWRDLPGQLFWQ